VLAAWSWHQALAPLAIAALATIFVYPLVWYVLHRFVLHGQFLYRSPLTAAMWKRIHFDHHQDPNDLSVLFGALYTTLPTIAIVTILTARDRRRRVVPPSNRAVDDVFGEFALRPAPQCPARTEFMKTIKRLHLSHIFMTRRAILHHEFYLGPGVRNPLSDLSERPRRPPFSTSDTPMTWLRPTAGSTRPAHKGRWQSARFRDEIGRSERA
jgi:hypothetical protein